MQHWSCHIDYRGRRAVMWNHGCFSACEIFLYILLYGLGNYSPVLFFSCVQINRANKKQAVIRSGKCHAKMLGLTRLLDLTFCSQLSYPQAPSASISSSPHCPMLVWSTCLRKSKARAANYSQLQKYWSVMVGPARGLVKLKQKQQHQS